MDATIGGLSAKLVELGINHNTLVVFTSDNGGAYEADNGPLKGGTTDLHEGGIRVPMIASWPGRIPTGVSRNAPASTIDLLPHWREGRSIDDRGPLFWQIDLYRTMQRRTPKPQPYATEAVSRGNWKLLARDGTPLELFNLADDVGESDNRHR